MELIDHSKFSLTCTKHLIVNLFSNFLHSVQWANLARIEEKKNGNFRASKGQHPPPTCSHPRRRDQEGKRRRIPVMQADIIPREIDLTNPLPPNCIRRQYTTPSSLPPRPFFLEWRETAPRPPPPPIARNDVIYPAYLMKPRLKTFFKTRFKSFEVETRDFPPDYSSSFLFLLLSLSVSLRRRRYQQ